MRKRSLHVALLLLAACAQPESEADEARIESESQSVRAELDRIIASYERWVAAGQVDSIATIVTDDHASMPPNLPSTSTKTDWLARFSPMFVQGTTTLGHVTESVVANGPIAIHRGRFTLNLVPGPNAPAGLLASVDTGKFIWHWRRTDGRWLLAAAIWNSNLAPTTPATR
jgi:ketosteroid isomerase-like protein